MLVPRNGYINRLQAWASAAILAQQLGLNLEIAWETEPIAAAKWQDLFALEQANARFCDISEVNEILGMPHQDWPRYLTVSRDRATVVLAGHDQGEQVFIPQLLEQLTAVKEARTLIIIAGGKFHTPDILDFEFNRQTFYTSINWISEIRDTVQTLINQHRDYIGLHIRGTDHARSAPTPHAIKAALEKLSLNSNLIDLYIAADTRETRERWHATALSLGLRPWSFNPKTYERASAASGIDAMIEWNLLAGSQGLVYSKISSFAEEASVASGFHVRSIWLSASPIRQRLRAISSFSRSAITYPVKGVKKVNP